MLMSLKTGGTMEFRTWIILESFRRHKPRLARGKCYSAGKKLLLPEMFSMLRLAKKERKERKETLGPPEHIAVTPQQELQLEGVRSDIFAYFNE